jgi:hypothetical protein
MKLCGVLEDCFDNKHKHFGHLSHCMCDHMSDNGEENICGLSGAIVEYYCEVLEYKELMKNE